VKEHTLQQEALRVARMDEACDAAKGAGPCRAIAITVSGASRDGIRTWTSPFMRWNGFWVWRFDSWLISTCGRRTTA
jgi:hypothetical protein